MRSSQCINSLNTGNCCRLIDYSWSINSKRNASEFRENLCTSDFSTTLLCVSYHGGTR